MAPTAAEVEREQQIRRAIAQAHANAIAHHNAVTAAAQRRRAANARQEVPYGSGGGGGSRARVQQTTGLNKSQSAEQARDSERDIRRG